MLLVNTDAYGFSNSQVFFPVSSHFLSQFSKLWILMFFHDQIEPWQSRNISVSHHIEPRPRNFFPTQYQLLMVMHWIWILWTRQKPEAALLDLYKIFQSVGVFVLLALSAQPAWALMGPRLWPNSINVTPKRNSIWSEDISCCKASLFFMNA